MSALEFIRLSQDWQSPLETFFADLEESGIEHYFYPHPFTQAEATRVCRYIGLDLYYVAVVGRRVLGYGLLRGWDEGYAIPSLGIALHPAVQGEGLGRALMHFLHAAARQRGSTEVRLKVHRDNLRAINLYKTFRYEFEPLEKTEQLIGILSLG